MIGDGKSSDLAIDLIAANPCTRNKTLTVILRLQDPKQSHVECSCECEHFCRFFLDWGSQHLFQNHVMWQLTV